MNTLDSTVSDLVARLDQNLREAFEERAGIREYDGGLPREHAECMALLDVVRRCPMALTGGTLLRADEGRVTRWVLSTDPDFAATSLASMGFTVHRRADLASVLARFDGTAVLSRVG